VTVVDAIHGGYVHGRRVRVLARHLASILPADAAHVLDVGCGDGALALRVMAERPGLRIDGIDVLVRPATHMAVTPFDGRTLPFADRAFDAALLVDVVHHADDPPRLLAEALRVSRRCVIVKDHLRDGWLAAPTLRFMDRVGNARHGVALPHHYWSRAEWMTAFQSLGVVPDEWRTELGLYPIPADWVFGRGLHFLARVRRR
jgi:SAM-dependent methyltransferase